MEGPVRVLTAYTYDAFSRVISESKTDCGTMYYEYDEKGRIAAVTDYNGNRSTLDRYRHAWSRPGPSVRSGGRPRHRYRYPSSLRDRSRIRYGLHCHRRVTAVTDEEGSTTRYTYDVFGNVLTVTDAMGNPVPLPSYS